MIHKETQFRVDDVLLDAIIKYDSHEEHKKWSKELDGASAVDHIIKSRDLIVFIEYKDFIKTKTSDLKDSTALANKIVSKIIHSIVGFVSLAKDKKLEHFVPADVALPFRFVVILHQYNRRGLEAKKVSNIALSVQSKLISPLGKNVSFITDIDEGYQVPNTNIIIKYEPELGIQPPKDAL